LWENSCSRDAGGAGKRDEHGRGEAGLGTAKITVSCCNHAAILIGVAEMDYLIGPPTALRGFRVAARAQRKLLDPTFRKIL
jgi:hypothetical protein